MTLNNEHVLVYLHNEVERFAEALGASNRFIYFFDKWCREVEATEREETRC